METKSEFSRLVANLSRLGLTKVADALPAYMAVEVNDNMSFLVG